MMYIRPLFFRTRHRNTDNRLVCVQRKINFRLSAYMSFTNEQRTTFSFLSTELLQHFLPTPNRTSAAIENIPTEKTITTTEYAIFFAALQIIHRTHGTLKKMGEKELKRNAMISFFLYFFSYSWFYCYYFLMPVSNLPLPGTHPPTPHILFSTFFWMFPFGFIFFLKIPDMKIPMTLRTWTTRFFTISFVYLLFTVFLNFDSSHYIHSKRTFGLDIWSPLYHDQCWWIHSPYPLLSPTFPFPIRSQLLSLLSNAPFRYLSPVSLYRFRWDLICLQFMVNVYLLIHY